MRRSRSHTFVSLEMVISNLKRELDEARCDIVDLMAPEVKQKLQSYYSLEERKDFYHWENSVIDFVVELAKPSAKNYYLEESANCPLCGGGGNSPYKREGYKIPGGLEFHLRGTGGAWPCPVMKHAFSLARESLEPKFVEADRQAADKLSARRKIETLFLVDPFDQPRLVDEGVWFRHRPRDQNGMERAEERLARLGFEQSSSENVKAYKLETDAYVVYADPREEKRIAFIVYRKPLPKKRAAARSWRFKMPDLWTNGLNEKFATLLTNALRNLE